MKPLNDALVKSPSETWNMKRIFSWQRRKPQRQIKPMWWTWMRLWRQERQPTWTLDSCHKASAVLLFPVHRIAVLCGKSMFFPCFFGNQETFHFSPYDLQVETTENMLAKYQAEHWITFRPETLQNYVNLVYVNSRLHPLKETYYAPFYKM